MRLKLDENLGERALRILVEAGHDVSNVPAESLTSATDEVVLNAASNDDRALVTLDLDFANPLVFVPSRYRGIVVLRLRSKPSLDDLLALVRTLGKTLEREDPTRKLWI